MHRGEKSSGNSLSSIVTGVSDLLLIYVGSFLSSANQIFFFYQSSEVEEWMLCATWEKHLNIVQNVDENGLWQGNHVIIEIMFTIVTICWFRTLTSKVGVCVSVGIWSKVEILYFSYYSPSCGWHKWQSKSLWIYKLRLSKPNHAFYPIQGTSWIDHQPAAGLTQRPFTGTFTVFRIYKLT